jgi:ABC-2 type transport system permease protein
LKRITTTPVKTWQFITSEVLSRIVLNFFQIAIIILIGVKVFGAHIYGNLLIVMLFAILGAILFQLMGFCIASVSKTTDAAEGMATAINIPMMFLAGVFFPIDSLPRWLYSIVQYLPLAPLLRILRGVALESKSPFDNPINIVIVGAWIAALLIIATYKFRLTEE